MSRRSSTTARRPAASARPDLLSVAKRLRGEAGRLEFVTPSHVYNPLSYAWPAHAEYLERYGGGAGRVVLLGMNPGPWGMAQTGVPFGDVAMVREWLGIEKPLSPPLPVRHPKYPILGFDCRRSEGSGSRLWGWARARFGTAGRFFARFFVWNYCPLLFLRDGRNLTPERLKREEAGPLVEACDRALGALVRALAPAAVVGVGRFAEARARAVPGVTAPVGYLPHPSPASPAANRGWGALADRALERWL